MFRSSAGTRAGVVLSVLLIAGFVKFGPVTTIGPACADGATLVVVASNEKSGLLSEMALDFAKTAPQVDGRCVTVKVVRKASGEAEEALARGWNESSDGSRPDVWSPAATTWVEILRAHRVGSDRSDLIPASMPSLIQSPLVIGMPRPMAEAMGWPDKPIGWHDVLQLARDPQGWARAGHPEWGRFRIGKTNPTVSTSGLHALVGTYYAATGVTNDLTPEDVGRTDVVAFVKDIEASVEHYGNTASVFLRNLGIADEHGDAMGYMSAIAVEEKQLWDYDRNAVRHTRLVAIYPSEGTLVADHPYVVLRAPWVDDAKRAAAALFLGYLQSPERQQRFRAEGFRDHEGRAGPGLTIETGFNPAGPQTVLRPPSPETLAAVEASWKDVRKRARVLMVLDVSGSMAGQKIDLMRHSAAKSLDLLLDDDDLGVWSFSTDRTEIAPIAAVGPRRASLASAIERLVPGGATRLYDTTYDAVRALAASPDPRRITAVVVLTDGMNSVGHGGNDDLERLIRELRTAVTETHVRAFTIAYGGDADKKVLQRIADATQGAAYDASKPESIETVFEEVVSNF